jgi:hypothetical protein
LGNRAFRAARRHQLFPQPSILTTQGSPPERTMLQTTSSLLSLTSWCSANALNCASSIVSEMKTWLLETRPNLRYEGKVARTQMLLLVPPFTDNGSMARESEDDSILLAMMMHGRGSMWFGNHPGGANVWSQAHQCICSLHALCLSTRDLERRALRDNDWLLFWHCFLVSLDRPRVYFTG